jgi:chromosome segregation ATPase
MDQLRTRAARFEALNRQIEDSIADRGKTIETLRAETGALRVEIETLRAAIETLRAEAGALRAENESARTAREAEMGGLRTALAQAHAEIAQIQAVKEAHVHELTEYIHTLEQTLDAKNQHIVGLEERIRRPRVKIGHIGRLLSRPRPR